MNVTVFGAGYVGLVQAAVLAEVGHNVTCVDIDENKVKRLTQGEIPIFEPGLSPIIIDMVKNGKLTFTTNAKQAVETGRVIFIAVGTPPDEDGSADLQYVLAVAKTIAENANGRKTVVTKSTVPVGTSDKVRDALMTNATIADAETQLTVVSNPEFLKEGSAVDDCKRPDRIIVGTDNNEDAQVMRDLYAAFNRNHDRVMVMSIRSAELTKYAANAMLATKISFMNEMSRLAEAMNADIEDVRHGIGSDPRIGYQFIYPGCGYGGSCFPKDVQALARSAEELGVDPSILNAVERVNRTQKDKIVEYIDRHFDKQDIRGKRFALWGLSFKPNTDDMREAPSRYVMEALWKRGAIIVAHDPEAMDETTRIYGERHDLVLMSSAEACLDGSDALIVCTEWNAFKNADLDLIGDALTDKVIFDGRNIFDPSTVEKAGIAYYGIGRGRSLHK